MAQCYETPKRSIDGDLRLPVADPGTARVSDLAGDRGSCTGEGGFSSAMRGRLSASASSTCTSGCSSVAGTGEGKEDTASERSQVPGALLCSTGKPQSVCVWRGLWQPCLHTGSTGELHAGDTTMRGGPSEGHAPGGHWPRSHGSSHDVTGAPGHSLEPSLVSLGLEKQQGPGVGIGVAALRKGLGSLPGGRWDLGSGLVQSGSAASSPRASVSPSQGRNDEAFPGPWGQQTWGYKISFFLIFY